MKTLFKSFRITLYFFAGLFIFLIIFAFTSGPFWIYYWLGTKSVDKVIDPKAIVMLSGGGVPSESALVRSFFTAKAARQHPEADVILAIPGDTSDISSSILMTRHELIVRGVDSLRIRLESDGKNTRSQALYVAKKFPEIMEVPIILITSPEHMRRSVLSFEKVGFQTVGGFPTFNRPLESDLSFSDDELGGKTIVPDVGNNLNVRYRFWKYLQLEIMIIREMIAMGYYKLNGWI